MTTPTGAQVDLLWRDSLIVQQVGRGLILLWSDLLAPDNELDLNDGVLLDVDLALREKLGGIYVTDAKNGAHSHAVHVFFRWPRFEVTDQTFPFITIELLRFERAADREQRGEFPSLPYLPKGAPSPTDGDLNFLYTEQFPIPYNLFYQITVHSRFNLHDREISFALMQDDKLPTRGGYVVVGDPGPSQNLRQMFVTGPVNADGVDPAPGGRPKRHFRKIWTAQVSAEFFQKDVVNLPKVITLVPTVEDLDDVVTV